MVGVFLQNKELNETFDISFSYRKSKEYTQGMDEWIADTPVKIHVFKYSSLFQFLKEINPDVLHINNGGYPGAFSCNVMAVAGKLARIPKITYFIASTTRNPWWYTPMTQMVKRSVDTFISASKNLCMESHYFLRSELRGKGYVDWSHISNTIRDIEIKSKMETRQELNIPQHEVVFLCMGDLEKRKGFYRAIDAFSEIENIGTPRSLLIVGKGCEEKNLRDRIQSKTKGVYRFITDTDIHPYAIINAADVLIVPSEGDEDWPNVILIAMKYAKSCIVSDVCGLPEMIENGNTGFIFRTDIDLKYSMDRLLNEDLRIIMGNRASGAYQRRYREEKIIGKYIDLWS